MSIDIEDCLHRARQCKLLTLPELKALCSMAEEIFIEESTVQPVSSPVAICGDIHGQFFDLTHLFEIGGDLTGDYVDRGMHSLETFVYLLLLKVRYPDRIVLLRGNHESRSITQMYGFYDECIQKYGTTEPWNWLMSVCDLLVLCAVVDGKVFCVHGGLSPELKTIHQIRALLNRNQDLPHDGPFCDLLWSDPEDVDGIQYSPRGAGFLFGPKPTQEFCHINNLNLICRAHQLVQEGYKYMFDDLLVTVWSAPNYCYRCGNVAAILQLDDHLERTFKIFDAVPEDEQRNRGPITPVQYFL